MRPFSRFAVLAIFVAVSGCPKSGTDSAVGTDSSTGADSNVATDSSVGTDSAATTDGAGTDATTATSGELTIEANGITGATGEAVLVFVTAAGGGPFLGAICESVTADPGSVSGVAAVPGAMNPCMLGATVDFPNGDYDLMGGVYTPGMMMPNQCSNTMVTVAGDTTVVMPPFGTCP